MSVPTEPGWYWWQPTPDSTPQVVSRGILTLACRCDPPGGIYGERILDNDTLKAMRTVLFSMEANDACPRVGGIGTSIRCAFCGATETLACGTSSHGPLEHKPDCPWLRAQEKQDGV